MGDTPQKATTSTPSKVPRLSELDQLLQQLEQYVPSAPNFALPEELDASPPTDWKTKYQQLAGQLGGLTRAYHFIGKQGSGPLSQVEKLVLGNLVHRHVHNDHGMPCLSVPPFTEEGSGTGRPVTFVSLRHPSAEEALGKTMGRRYKQLWDLMEWLCHGDTPQLQDMHKRLFRDLVPKGVITLQVPPYGTLSLQKELALSGTQLRGLREILASWGNNFLDGWRKVQAQEEELSYPLVTSSMRLQVATTTTLDPLDPTASTTKRIPKYDTVFVVGVCSFCDYFDRKIKILLDHNALCYPKYIQFSSQLYVIIHCDSGQGSTKLSVRVLNVNNPRSQHNCDILAVFEGMETYDNVKLAFRSLLEEIERMHCAWRTICGRDFFITFFLCADHKMVSTMYGHAGASSTFFTALDYAKLDDLQAGKIPGGYTLPCYRHLASQGVASDGGVEWVEHRVRLTAELTRDAVGYQEAERKRKEETSLKTPTSGVPFHNITKGTPLLLLAPKFVVPPVVYTYPYLPTLSPAHTYLPIRILPVLCLRTLVPIPTHTYPYLLTLSLSPSPSRSPSPSPLSLPLSLSLSLSLSRSPSPSPYPYPAKPSPHRFTTI